MTEPALPIFPHRRFLAADGSFYCNICTLTAQHYVWPCRLTTKVKPHA